MKRNRIFAIPTALLLLVTCQLSLVTAPLAPASDISITAASVSMSSLGLYKAVVAGEAITAGQSVYVNPTDGKLYKAKGTAAATASISNSGGGGVAINSAPGAGQYVTYCYYDPSFTLGGTIASGTVVYVSAGAFGGITGTFADLASTNVAAVLGVGIGSNKIFLNPTLGGALP